MMMLPLEGPPGYSKSMKVDVPETPHDYAMILIEAFRLKQECLEKENKALKEKVKELEFIVTLARQIIDDMDASNTVTNG